MHFFYDSLLRKVGYERSILLFPPIGHSAGEVTRAIRIEFGDT